MPSRSAPIHCCRAGFGLARIQLREAVERGIDGDDLIEVALGDRHHIAQFHPLPVAVPFLGFLLPRVVHKNAPHQLRRDSEEVRPVAPVDIRLPDQLQIRLIYESGRLQSVPGSFALHVMHRDPPQFGIHGFEQPRLDFLSARAQFTQHTRDVFASVHGFFPL